MIGTPGKREASLAYREIHSGDAGRFHSPHQVWRSPSGMVHSIYLCNAITSHSNCSRPAHNPLIWTRKASPFMPSRLSMEKVCCKLVWSKCNWIHFKPRLSQPRCGVINFSLAQIVVHLRPGWDSNLCLVALYEPATDSSMTCNKCGLISPAIRRRMSYDHGTQ